MLPSSITGGREWHLTSNEKIDTFWKEFQKEVHEILQKYPQLSTAKRIRRFKPKPEPPEDAKKDENQKQDEEKLIVTTASKKKKGGKKSTKSKAKNKNIIIRSFRRQLYDDEEDCEVEEAQKKAAATRVQSLFNSRPIIISEYPIEEFPRLYALHEWDMTRITPEKQWQIKHQFGKIIENDKQLLNQKYIKTIYNKMRKFARGIRVSLEKMLSFLAFCKYDFLRNNYEYLRYSFAFETPSQQYIQQQLQQKQLQSQQTSQQQQSNTNHNGEQLLIVNQSQHIPMARSVDTSKHVQFKVGRVSSIGDGTNLSPSRVTISPATNPSNPSISQNIDPLNVSKENKLPFVINQKWAESEDKMLTDCFNKWRDSLPLTAIIDHTKFLKYAHQELSHRLHRTNDQITRRWRNIRSRRYDLQANARIDGRELLIINQSDPISDICINSTLYTSLLNIYRMNFLSAHEESRRGQHLANLFQALIYNLFSEVEAQNMRQALFHGQYFIVRERNEYQRLPRYDLPTNLYTFLEKPLLLIPKLNNRKRERLQRKKRKKKKKNKKQKKIFNVYPLSANDCQDASEFTNILHEMTKDILADPFGNNVNDDVMIMDMNLTTKSLPIISLQPDTPDLGLMELDNDETVNASPKNKRLKPMPLTDVYEILDIDTNEIINQCYTEILENEYKEKGMDEIPNIKDENDVAQFLIQKLKMKIWKNDENNEYHEDEEEKKIENEALKFNGICRYYGDDADKFYHELMENGHDETLCDIILNILYDSYNNQNISFGVEINNKNLFCHKKIETYFFDKFECDKKLRINHKNYILENIRYLYNTFEILMVGEFLNLKLVPTKLLLDNPKLSYFCIFPYEYDPTASERARKNRNKNKNGDNSNYDHGVAFIREYDKCYICAPWITNDIINHKPVIDSKLVYRLKTSILSIIFNNPGIDLWSLYNNFLMKYILTPLQLLQICRNILKVENNIKIVQYPVFQKSFHSKNTFIDSRFRFFALL